MVPVTNGMAKQQNSHGQSWKATPEKAVVKRADSIYYSEASRSRYEAYSRLQASAVAFGEKLPIPEIVAVGGQSDGKSSLLEALLGFRFNIKEVEMGTRRPLMLQMVHDPEALEPRCRLQVSGRGYLELISRCLGIVCVNDRHCLFVYQGKYAPSTEQSLRKV